MTDSAPLHVGLLATELGGGYGWASYALNLSRALIAAGVRVTVVIPRRAAPVEDIPTLPLLPSFYPRESPFMLKLAFALPDVRQALRDCTIIHATAEPYAPLAAAIAGNRPLVVTGHGSYVQPDKAWRPPVSALYRRAFRRALMVCVSRYTARVAEAALPGLRTAVVNNGVDAARFASPPPLSRPKRGPTVLTVGGVKPRKGTLELVRAIAVVRQTIANVQCMIAGSLRQEPAYAAQVQAEIERLGLVDCVHLPGHLADDMLLGWYGSADVFVLPSMNDGWKFEGYGLTLIEAGAAGLPVIGTTDCGNEDAVDDGVTGLLVPQRGIAEALPQAIIRLLSDTDMARRMGAAGRAKARRQTWERVAGQMIDLYRTCGDEQ